MTRKSMSKKEAGIRHGWRSGLEESVGKELDSLGITYGFEVTEIPFVQPKKNRKYTPDFTLNKKGSKTYMFIETKGRFTVHDRMKHLYVKKSRPDLDIRFIFSNSKARIAKTSKTTYGQWCEKHGFKYSDKFFPKEWLEEVEK